MPDKKLTDNLSNNSPILSNSLTDAEIKKALECAIRNNCDCNCVFLLPNKVQDVLDLINRLQADYETLNQQEEKAHQYCKNVCEPKYKAEVERLKDYNENLQTANTALSNEILETKAEAYKEFSEKLKEFIHNKFKDLDEYEFEYVTTREIDNLLKELVGEDNAG